MTRIILDVFSADPHPLATKINEFCAKSDEELTAAKEREYQIGYDNYSVQAVKPRWEEVLRG